MAKETDENRLFRLASFQRIQEYKKSNVFLCRIWLTGTHNDHIDEGFSNAIIFLFLCSKWSPIDSSAEQKNLMKNSTFFSLGQLNKSIL